MIILFIPMLLIKVFDSIDNEVNLKMSYRFIFLNSIFASMIGYFISKIYSNRFQMIHLSILIAYLWFMGYVDRKSKTVYTSVSVIMLLIEFVISIFTLDKTLLNEYTWTVALVLLILFIMSMVRMIGLGDVLIYGVISMYYVQTRLLPTISLMIVILVANVIFIIVNVIKAVVRKIKKANYQVDSKDKQYEPLAECIALSTIICCIALV
jgi:hypothetical protein